MLTKKNNDKKNPSYKLPKPAPFKEWKLATRAVAQRQQVDTSGGIGLAATSCHAHQQEQMVFFIQLSHRDLKYI